MSWRNGFSLKWKREIAKFKRRGAVIFIWFLIQNLKKKFQINKHAFSGGQVTLEDQRRLGANTDIDVSYQLLRFFLPDDEQLESVRVSYSKGEMLSGEIKKLAIDTLTPIVLEHQEQRKLVTDVVLDQFMAIRKLNF